MGKTESLPEYHKNPTPKVGVTWHPASTAEIHSFKVAEHTTFVKGAVDYFFAARVPACFFALPVRPVFRNSFSSS